MAKPTKPRIRVQAPSQATDSIQNFSARIGLGTPNIQSTAAYGLNPISRNRQELEWAYRGSWIVRQVVDAPAEDMTRAGIELQGQIKPDDIDRMQRSMQALQVWQKLRETIQWSRLYGGAVGYLIIDGQNPSLPLRIDTIKLGQFKGIIPLDRWMVQPSLTERVQELGPDFGMPEFYSIISAQGLPRIKIHYTRVVRFDGEDLPFYQKQSENGWGLSVCEPMWDRLLAFDSGTVGAAQLLHKAYLRTIKIENLRDLLAAGGKAAEAVARNVDWIRMFQSGEGLTMLDSRDSFETHQYAFGGIGDVLLQLAQQLAGATQIPLVRLFGQSPAGLNATGESDIRFYYDAILSQQESRMRRPFGVILDVLHRSTLGRPPDASFNFVFRPLWQMSAKERADIAQVQASTITAIDGTGAIDNATILRELRQASPITGMWSNITDEMIEDAENEPPEPPEGDPTGLSDPDLEAVEQEGGEPEDRKKAA